MKSSRNLYQERITRIFSGDPILSRCLKLLIKWTPAALVFNRGSVFQHSGNFRTSWYFDGIPPCFSSAKKFDYSFPVCFLLSSALLKASIFCSKSFNVGAVLWRMLFQNHWLKFVFLLRIFFFLKLQIVSFWLLLRFIYSFQIALKFSEFSYFQKLNFSLDFNFFNFDVDFSWSFGCFQHFCDYLTDFFICNLPTHPLEG